MVIVTHRRGAVFEVGISGLSLGARATVCSTVPRKATAEPWFGTDTRPLGKGSGWDWFGWVGKDHTSCCPFPARAKNRAPHCRPVAGPSGQCRSLGHIFWDNQK